MQLLHFKNIFQFTMKSLWVQKSLLFPGLCLKMTQSQMDNKCTLKTHGTLSNGDKVIWSMDWNLTNPRTITKTFWWIWDMVGQTYWQTWFQIYIKNILQIKQRKPPVKVAGQAESARASPSNVGIHCIKGGIYGISWVCQYFSKTQSWIYYSPWSFVEWYLDLTDEADIVCKQFDWNIIKNLKNCSEISFANQET